MLTQTPNDIQLSHKAMYELKAILERDIGFEALALMDDDDIRQLGMFVLTLTATALHKHMRTKKTIEY
ncbi:hypothetical protein L0P88_13645 [Muricauda sp. SCSIO 64092]|uniref:hypothetical protein n=1 Tax=Allomuricauda sp. SCSIO 64092 TaxID=2908842 RepID=UPI001FF14E9E|nr:hypothetical protein [Muricauda sp. SCSIO 64092]UOY04995.1 hypothetical protein L0P88_13645 [Muricauda sp. SCSIO 64092]